MGDNENHNGESSPQNSLMCHTSGVFPYSFLASRIVFPLNNLEARSRYIMDRNMDIEEMVLMKFTKEDYNRIVQGKRELFILEHFSSVINELFQKLREDAEKMRNCHHEVSFECPDHFNVDRTELILRNYFKDLGYETVADPRKDEDSTITLTLT